VIDEASKTIDQDLWVTRMADTIKEEGSAEWIINNDADEFWQPSSDESLVSALQNELSSSQIANDQIGVVYCGRYNYIGSHEAVESPMYSYRDNAFKVMTDWKNAEADLNLADSSSVVLPNGKHVIIRTLPGKVVTRLDDLLSEVMGNHGAKHKLCRIPSKQIKIIHYPIRTFDQFSKKVINYGTSLENNERFGEQVSFHLRLWYESFKSVELLAV